MEDIAAIVVTSFSSNVHSEVFLQAAEKGVALVFCRNYKPVSILLPANRSTDTLLTRALVDLSPAIKQRLWKKTIDAKTINQYALATTVAPESPVLAAFKSSMEGIHPRKEAACAKHFWRIFGASAASPDFARDPMGGSLNTLLNFGYAILLALVLRHLYAVC